MREPLWYRALDGAGRFAIQVVIGLTACVVIAGALAYALWALGRVFS